MKVRERGVLHNRPYLFQMERNLDRIQWTLCSMEYQPTFHTTCDQSYTPSLPHDSRGGKGGGGGGGRREKGRGRRNRCEERTMNQAGVAGNRAKERGGKRESPQKGAGRTCRQRRELPYTIPLPGLSLSLQGSVCRGRRLP